MGTSMNLDYDRMESIGNEIGKGEGDLRDFVEKMQSQVNALREVWESDAARAFEDTWNEIKPSLDKLHQELIPDIAQRIKTSAANYRSAEEANMGR